MPLSLPVNPGSKQSGIHRCRREILRAFPMDIHDGARKEIYLPLIADGKNPCALQVGSDTSAEPRTASYYPMSSVCCIVCLRRPT